MTQWQWRWTMLAVTANSLTIIALGLLWSHPPTGALLGVVFAVSVVESLIMRRLMAASWRHRHGDAPEPGWGRRARA